MSQEHEQATQIVESYAEHQWRLAWERVEKEIKGEGCGCPACQMEAVDEVNQWTDFIAGEQDFGLYYSYDPYKRQIHRPDWADRKLGGE